MVANTRVINGNLQDTELTESLLVVTIGVNEKKIIKKKNLIHFRGLFCAFQTLRTKF